MRKKGIRGLTKQLTALMLTAAMVLGPVGGSIQSTAASQDSAAVTAVEKTEQVAAIQSAAQKADTEQDTKDSQQETTANTKADASKDNDDKESAAKDTANADASGKADSKSDAANTDSKSQDKQTEDKQTVSDKADNADAKQGSVDTGDSKQSSDDASSKDNTANVSDTKHTSEQTVVSPAKDGKTETADTDKKSEQSDADEKNAEKKTSEEKTVVEKATDVENEAELSEAFSAFKSVDGVIITVTAPEGVVPTGTKLHAKKVSKQATLDKVNEAIGEASEAEETAEPDYVFDIKLVYNGEEIEPDTSYGDVNVTFTLDKEDVKDSDKISVYHIKEQDETLTANAIADLKVSQDTLPDAASKTQLAKKEITSISFDTESFSYYAVMLSSLDESTETCTITVDYGYPVIFDNDNGDYYYLSDKGRWIETEDIATAKSKAVSKYSFTTAVGKILSDADNNYNYISSSEYIKAVVSPDEYIVFRGLHDDSGNIYDIGHDFRNYVPTGDTLFEAAWDEVSYYTIKLDYGRAPVWIPYAKYSGEERFEYAYLKSNNKTVYTDDEEIAIESAQQNTTMTVEQGASISSIPNISFVYDYETEKCYKLSNEWTNTDNTSEKVNLTMDYIPTSDISLKANWEEADVVDVYFDIGNGYDYLCEKGKKLNGSCITDLEKIINATKHSSFDWVIYGDEAETTYSYRDLKKMIFTKDTKLMPVDIDRQTYELTIHINNGTDDTVSETVKANSLKPPTIYSSTLPEGAAGYEFYTDKALTKSLDDYLTDKNGYCENLDIYIKWIYTGEWVDNHTKYKYSDGNYAKDTLITDGDDIYYIGSDEKIITNQWKSVPAEAEYRIGYGINKWYYYFGDDGKAYKAYESDSGYYDVIIKEVTGKPYLFDENGHRLVGFCDYSVIDDPVGSSYDSGNYYCGKLTDANDSDVTKNALVSGWVSYVLLYDYKSFKEGDTVWFYYDPDSFKRVEGVSKVIDGLEYSFDECGMSEKKGSKRITVTFNADGGTIGTAYTYYYADDKKWFNNKIIIPSRGGYEFQGYTTEKDGKGQLVFDAEGYAEDSFTSEKDITLYAAWKKVAGETDCWIQENGKWIYIGSDGEAVKNELIQDAEDTYYVDSDGYMVTDQWIAIPSEKLNNEDLGQKHWWFYFGSDGKAYKDSHGKTIDGLKYGFDEDGCSLFGFVDDGSYCIHSNEEDPALCSDYYYGSVEDYNRDTHKGYNSLYTGWLECTADEDINDDIQKGDTFYVYYDLDTGRKLVDTSREIDGVTYSFDEAGISNRGTKTNYKVEHYKQSVDGTSYEKVEADTDTLEGKVGGSTEAKAKSYEGFTPKLVVNKKIAADSETVVEIKYDRNKYSINFNMNGHGSQVAAVEQYYEGNVSAPTAPAADGYFFAGWYKDAECTTEYGFSTMPLNGITVYAKWTEMEVKATAIDTSKVEFDTDASANVHEALSQISANTAAAAPTTTLATAVDTEKFTAKVRKATPTEFAADSYAIKNVELALKVDTLSIEESADKSITKIEYEVKPYANVAIAAIADEGTTADEKTITDMEVSNDLLNGKTIDVKLPIVSESVLSSTAKYVNVLHEFSDGGSESFTSRISGKGNDRYVAFNVSKFSKFTLTFTDAYYEIADISPVAYTGKKLKPGVNVTIGGETVDASKYNVYYTNNLNAGTATAEVYIKSTGDTITKSFEIIPATPVITASDVNVTYDGAAHAANGRVSIPNGITLPNKHLKVKYFTDADCTEGESDAAPSKVGTYYALLYVDETDNYDYAEKIVKITINAKSSSGGSSSGTSSGGSSNGTSSGGSSGGSSSGGNSSSNHSSGGSSSGGSGGGGGAYSSGVAALKFGAGSTAALVPDKGVAGTWKKNELGKWTFTSNDKHEYSYEWAYIANPNADTAKGQEAASWFRFGTDGTMLTGWYKNVYGDWYYLNPISDNTMGAMLKGWQYINGYWYYLEEKEAASLGRLYVSKQTPDGKTVDAEGRWVKNGAAVTDANTKPTA